MGLRLDKYGLVTVLSLIALCIWLQLRSRPDLGHRPLATFHVEFHASAGHGTVDLADLDSFVSANPGCTWIGQSGHLGDTHRFACAIGLKGLRWTPAVRHIYSDHVESRKRRRERRPDDDDIGHPTQTLRIFELNPANQDTSEGPHVASNITEEKLEEPYFFSDPMFPAQWHLVNQARPGHDLNVLPLWKQGMLGSVNITVCIMDFGVEVRHPDLAEQFVPAASYDVNADRREIQATRGLVHGTRCAGQVAAQANNGVCGVGVAPRAKFSNIKMLEGPVSSMQEHFALTYGLNLLNKSTDAVDAHAQIMQGGYNDIYSCSWGPSDDGASLEGPDRLLLKGLLKGVLQGRAGLGALYLFAAGNGGRVADNCNMDGFAASPLTVTVGALSSTDAQPVYMERCAAMHIVTYSSDTAHSLVTADSSVSAKTGACTRKHGGTSAAAPLVAGVLALLLAHRPALTWRDVQSLLLHAAARPDGPLAVAAQWQRNAAGLPYSHMTGFGKLDAARLLRLASRPDLHPLLGPPVLFSLPWQIVHDGAIPYDEVGLVVAQNITEATLQTHLQPNLALVSSLRDAADGSLTRRFYIEHVTVMVDLEHRERGDLSLYLSSPAGTVAQLLSPRPIDTLPTHIPKAEPFDSFSEYDGQGGREEGIKHARPLEWDYADLRVDRDGHKSWVGGNGLANWTFGTLLFWGEQPLGTWTLRVVDDLHPATQGRLKAYRVTLWGEWRDLADSRPAVDVVHRALDLATDAPIPSADSLAAITADWWWNETLWRRDAYQDLVLEAYFPAKVSRTQPHIPQSDDQQTASTPTPTIAPQDPPSQPTPPPWGWTWVQAVSACVVFMVLCVGLYRCFLKGRFHQQVEPGGDEEDAIKPWLPLARLPRSSAGPQYAPVPSQLPGVLRSAPLDPESSPLVS